MKRTHLKQGTRDRLKSLDAQFTALSQRPRGTVPRGTVGLHPVALRSSLERMLDGERFTVSPIVYRGL